MLETPLPTHSTLVFSYLTTPTPQDTTPALLVLLSPLYTSFALSLRFQFAMSSTQRELARPRASTLKLPRKPSTRDLRHESRTQQDLPINVEECQIPPVPTFATPKRCPARGLKIDVQVATRPKEAESLLPLRSAPANRTIRRLPSLPVSLPSRPSTSPSPSGSSSLLRHASMAPPNSRGKRPLPSLPPPNATGALPTIDTNVASSSSLPTSHRTSKPLPTPVQKIEHASVAFPPPLDALEAIQEVDATPPPTPPKPITQQLASSASPSRTPKRKSKHETLPANDMPAPKTPKKSSAQALRSKDAPTAVMLHAHMVLERNMKLNSLRDSISDDSFFGDAIAAPVFRSPNGANGPLPITTGRRSGDAPEVVGHIVSEKDTKNGADYAFVLANRIVYQQTSNDGRSTLTSKWVREVKGKRYTEQNFDNVMKALRTL